MWSKVLTGDRPSGIFRGFGWARGEPGAGLTSCSPKCYSTASGALVLICARQSAPEFNSNLYFFLFCNNGFYFESTKWPVQSSSVHVHHSRVAWSKRWAFFQLFFLRFWNCTEQCCEYFPTICVRYLPRNEKRPSLKPFGCCIWHQVCIKNGQFWKSSLSDVKQGTNTWSPLWWQH